MTALLNEVTLKAGVEHARRHLENALRQLDLVDDETWESERLRCDAALGDINSALVYLRQAEKCLEYTAKHLAEATNG